MPSLLQDFEIRGFKYMCCTKTSPLSIKVDRETRNKDLILNMFTISTYSILGNWTFLKEMTNYRKRIMEHFKENSFPKCPGPCICKFRFSRTSKTVNEQYIFSESEDISFY